MSVLSILSDDARGLRRVLVVLAGALLAEGVWLAWVGGAVGAPEVVACGLALCCAGLLAAVAALTPDDRGRLRVILGRVFAQPRGTWSPRLRMRRRGSHRRPRQPGRCYACDDPLGLGDQPFRACAECRAIARLKRAGGAR